MPYSRNETKEASSRGAAAVEDQYRGHDPPVVKPCHRAAMEHIRSQALALQPAASTGLEHVFRMSNIAEPLSSIRAATRLVAQHVRIALHFHPDRPVLISDTSSFGQQQPGLTTVAQSLLRDGVYRTQFETRISNGSVSAHPGGARDEWERELFAGAYHSPEATAADRPRYGALDVMRCADGPAPRFGSCFFLLRPEVGTRATVTFGGSQDLPRWRGVLEPAAVEQGALDAVMLQLFEECFSRDSVLGVSGIRPRQLMERIQNLQRPLRGEDGGTASHNLDHLVEVQVHGEVKLGRDVEMLIADPSFKSTPTGGDLVAMGTTHGFPVRWHAGFQMLASDVPSDFRGPTMPSLAHRIADRGVINAATIGCAVRSLAAEPSLWVERGSYEEVLQELKLIWHVLVCYGRPII